MAICLSEVGFLLIMSEQKLLITPETTVADLLEYYPGLEQRLLELSPSFAKLKNPLLRRTVARITTLRRAAQVAGLNAIDMVNTLRKVAGQSPLQESSLQGVGDELLKRLPIEMGAIEPTLRLDVRPLLERGAYPKEEVLERVESMERSDTLELIAPFPPIPILEILLERGYHVSQGMQTTDVAVHYYIRRS